MSNLEKIVKWLGTTSYEGVVLGRRDNFKWITEENANAVVTNGEVGIAFLVIEKSGKVKMIADSSDCPRMSEEQNALGAECILAPWYETLDGFLADCCRGKKYASDTGISDTVYVQGELVDLRMQLSQKELERYREIGQECARIVERVAKDARPGQTENEVAAMLKCRCIEKGVGPDCVLVGSDDRILKYRHPVPTDKKIEKSLMVVLGGEKYGLNISMTRIVSYGKPDKEIAARMKKTQYIFASMQNMMEDGMAYSEYFRKVQKLYDEAGWPDEWKMHHQGGPTGYGCREFVVTPDTKGALREGQAYAWNPTILGTKCEETTYLKDGRVEILTRTKDWPCTVVETEYGSLDVADILIVS